MDVFGIDSDQKNAFGASLVKADPDRWLIQWHGNFLRTRLLSLKCNHENGDNKRNLLDLPLLSPTIQRGRMNAQLRRHPSQVVVGLNQQITGERHFLFG